MQKYDSVFLADFKEISLHECGIERCQPNKIVKYTPKEHHTFHYVLNGKGTYEHNGRTFKLKKGDLFYIASSDTATYYPDPKDPWTYIWIGFKGERVFSYLNRLNINEEYPIFSDNNKLELRSLFLELSEAYSRAKYLNIETLSVFMKIIYKMTIIRNDEDEVLGIKDMHIRNAKQFIIHNYQHDIKVTEIASSLGLSVNYLANIFKERIQSSPKQYLIYYRMHIASQLLIETDTPINEIAKAVGYNNPLYFSTEFKKINNLSPRLYRKANSF